MLAFARRFCSQQPSIDSKHRHSLPPIIQKFNTRLSYPPCRSFTSAPRSAANIQDTPREPPIARPPTTRKRTIRIGPLPDGEVDRKAIKEIFGPEISLIDGNNILRILHHRRTSGSLADYGIDNLGHRYAHVDTGLATKALDWLRERYPVDEARAAEEWAEKEANRISYELWLADPENADSKYNDPARVYKEQHMDDAGAETVDPKYQVWKERQKEVEEINQHDEQKIGILRIGPSEFERNIERKRKERLAAVAQKAEEKERKEKEDEEKLATGEWVRTPGGTQLMKPGQTTYVDIFGREQVSRRKEMQEYYQKKAESPFKSPEDMLKASTLVRLPSLPIHQYKLHQANRLIAQTQRLYPMTAFVIIVCLASYGFAHYYISPSPTYRLWPELSSTTATLSAITAANILICAMWRWNPLWPFMTRYFMHVPGYPRAIQSVLNVFSHIQYEHLLSNMMYFALIGTVCHDLVGRGIFLGTYVSAGAVGSLFTLYWANLGRGAITAHSLGASAAIWGISALYLLLTEKESIKIPFVKDMEVGFYPKSLVVAFMTLEVWRATRKNSKSTMDHASHFGGMIVGSGVAGYLRATGFHEKKKSVTKDGVETRAGVDEGKVVDVAAIIKEEVKEVKEGIKKVVAKEGK